MKDPYLTVIMKQNRFSEILKVKYQFQTDRDVSEPRAQNDESDEDRSDDDDDETKKPAEEPLLSPRQESLPQTGKASSTRSINADSYSTIV